MPTGWFDKLLGEWRLEGWDTFAGHSYTIAGRYRTRASAIRGARRQLRKLERTQPSETSGGQAGIQDQVFVIGPDGENFRVTE